MYHPEVLGLSSLLKPILGESSDRTQDLPRARASREPPQEGAHEHFFSIFFPSYIKYSPGALASVEVWLIIIIIIIIIIISAHKSDLSNPWSQTQASLSMPSLHKIKNKKKKRKRGKNNRRESLPRSDRRGGEKIKTRAKIKSKDPPRISERQINKQARQTKVQDHTTVDTVRESLSTPHQSLGGGSGQ